MTADAYLKGVTGLFLVVALLGCPSAQDERGNPEPSGIEGTGTYSLPSVATKNFSDNQNIDTCEWFSSLQGLIVGVVEYVDFVTSPSYLEHSTEKIDQCNGLVEPSLKVKIELEYVYRGSIDENSTIEFYVGSSIVRDWSTGLDYALDAGWFGSDRSKAIVTGQRLVVPLHRGGDDLSEWTLGMERLFVVNEFHRVELQDGPGIDYLAALDGLTIAEVKAALFSCPSTSSAGEARTTHINSILANDATYGVGALCMPLADSSTEGCAFSTDCEDGEVCIESECQGEDENEL